MGTIDRLFLPVIAGVLTLAFALAAMAQVGDRVADVRVLGNCEGCVFDGQNFSDRKLTGINLVSAQLSDISFDRTAMNIAIFDGADLRGVSFTDADLSGASFVRTVNGGVKTGHVAAQNQASVGVPSAMARALVT